MAARNVAAIDEQQTTTRVESADAPEIKTTQAELDEKMPETVKSFNRKLVASLGRTFMCPECGQPSGGKCTDCGYTHQRYRNNK